MCPSRLRTEIRVVLARERVCVCARAHKRETERERDRVREMRPHRPAVDARLGLCTQNISARFQTRWERPSPAARCVISGLPTQTTQPVQGHGGAGVLTYARAGVSRRPAVPRPAPSEPGKSTSGAINTPARLAGRAKQPRDRTPRRRLCIFRLSRCS